MKWINDTLKPTESADLVLAYDTLSVNYCYPSRMSFFPWIEHSGPWQNRVNPAHSKFCSAALWPRCGSGISDMIMLKQCLSRFSLSEKHSTPTGSKKQLILLEYQSKNTRVDVTKFIPQKRQYNEKRADVAKLVLLMKREYE
jgi:hypothetical protein